MDPTLYEAATKGRVDVISQYTDQLDVQITHTKNTTLHVAAQFNKLPFVKEILKNRPSLLCQVNAKGETPLHMAVREGHSDIVKALIECAKDLDRELESGGGTTKEMLRARNYEDKDTALHMAVRKKHNLEVVKLLAREDAEFSHPHPANKAEETPLYLASERGYGDLVDEILKNCKSAAYGGPGGRTVLHGATLFSQDSESIIKSLLDWKPDLIKEVDAYGWTPLHYAARYGYKKGVKQLLEMDKSVAYIITADQDDKKTALHIAAIVEEVGVMEEILSHCPDCWDMVTSKGQSVLHIAVDMSRGSVIQFILKKPWLGYLINQKDIEGNTPIHLLALLAANSKLKGIFKKLLDHALADLNAFNNKNLTPIDVIWSINERVMAWPIGSGRIIVKNYQREGISAKREERVKKQKEMAESHMIVATLIATVAFAAGFTIPGGFDGNQGPKQGTPFLIRKAAFKAFVITNTIAVICSISSVLLYLSASLIGVYNYNDQRKQTKRYRIAFCLILISVGAMLVAFITGTYAVLEHSLGLAIAVCAISFLSFFIYLFEFKYYLVTTIFIPIIVFFV